MVKKEIPSSENPPAIIVGGLGKNLDTNAMHITWKPIGVSQAQERQFVTPPQSARRSPLAKIRDYFGI